MTARFGKIYSASAAFIAIQLWAGAALAAPPASVVGNWSIQANQAAGQLIVSQESVITGTCKRIVGTAFAHPMHGIYCPSTGRIQFLRLNANQRVEQVYTGNVGDAVGGSPLRMAGTFTVTVLSAGFYGEYNFNADK
jgi:hypothetical protein